MLAAFHKTLYYHIIDYSVFKSALKIKFKVDYINESVQDKVNKANQILVST